MVRSQTFGWSLIRAGFLWYKFPILILVEGGFEGECDLSFLLQGSLFLSLVTPFALSSLKSLL
jgi:hypothetical protein